ncbi:MAG: hypothetical protein ACLQPH_20595 [Acidimicrobiales bacterium]
MKYSEQRRRPGAPSRRSIKVSLSPYLIEDVAMTLGEVTRARAADPLAGRHP